MPVLRAAAQTRLVIKRSLWALIPKSRPGSSCLSLQLCQLNSDRCRFSHQAGHNCSLKLDLPRDTFKMGGLINLLNQSSNISDPWQSLKGWNLALVGLALPKGAAGPQTCHCLPPSRPLGAAAEAPGVPLLELGWEAMAPESSGSLGGPVSTWSGEAEGGLQCQDQPWAGMRPCPWAPGEKQKRGDKAWHKHSAEI